MFTHNLSSRQTEELLVEGNIMLKNTDMDVRMGKAIDPYAVWHWWNRYLLGLVASELSSLDEIFALNSAPKNGKQKLLGAYFRKSADATRDQYMEEIYANVTVNLSHLAATLIIYCLENGQQLITHQQFFNSLYIAVKRLQNNTRINLHRSLLNPYEYSDLTSGTNKRFEQFICVAKHAELISEEACCYHFLPKLLQEFNFDQIRLENPIAVYHNEVRPITAVRDALIEALHECDNIDPQQLAQWYFDDECRYLVWERHAYSKPRFDDINNQETATADATPFFLHPKKPNGIGILLIHGLLASPAELRDYGNYLAQQGYTVLGMRLRGHGSSPYALLNQTYEDWYSGVQRGFTMLKAYTARIFVTGFSTGGALALKLAAENNPDIIGTIAIALPIKFINPAFMLVSLLHGTNQLVDSMSSYEGIKPFVENVQEHPDINYHHIPVKSLYELNRLIHDLNNCLSLCTSNILILHGDHDPVVSVKSANHVMDTLSQANKQLTLIPSNKHGILMENIGETWAVIDEFMNKTKSILNR
jgi:esterase/lipase